MIENKRIARGIAKVRLAPQPALIGWRGVEGDARRRKARMHGVKILALEIDHRRIGARDSFAHMQ